MREDVKRLLDQAKKLEAERLAALDVKTKPVASQKVVVKPVTKNKTKQITGGTDGQDRQGL